MFAISIAAKYEKIVRTTLIDYAEKCHLNFQIYAESNLKRMNSKVSLGDLRGYALNFGLKPSKPIQGIKKSTIFHELLESRRKAIKIERGLDLGIIYGNLFTWRHSHTHSGTIPASFDDENNSHGIAKNVIEAFVEAFESE